MNCDLILNPKQESFVECNVDALGRTEVNALLALKCQWNGLSLLKEVTTSEWSGIIMQNIIRVKVKNISRNTFEIKKGEVFCQAKSLMHSDFVQLTKQILEEKSTNGNESTDVDCDKDQLINSYEKEITLKE